MKRKVILFCCFFILEVNSLSVYADQEARQWLTKMGLAAQDLNYRGTFVYQHGMQLESMEITHRVKKGATTERLLSLNSSPREIIRDNNVIRCYLPDENSMVIEHRKANDQNFPRILPKNLTRLEDNYTFQLAKRHRIADRMAQKVIIKPVDNKRYGYRLWADINSGLLLKSDLVDSKDKVLEQFMFTNLEIGGVISDKDLQPRQTSMNLKKHIKTEKEIPLTNTEWHISEFPKGFTISVHIKRLTPMSDKSIEHMVLSDGLAAVSVFIEKLDKSDQILSGANSMGAVNAFVREVSGHQVTVVGEVPAVTVKAIANAVVMNKKS